MSSDIIDDTRRWDTFMGWARRFYEWPGFNREERDYKVVVADRLRAVRKALIDDEGVWLELVRQAMRPPNNLVYWAVKAAFPVWCEEHPAEARQALMHLWDGTAAASVQEHVDRFKAEVDRDAIGGQGAMFASFLLMAQDPTTYPMYRNEAYVLAYHLTGYPDRPKHGSGAIYQHALDFLDRLVLEARRRGLPLRDRLDAQGVLWCVTWYKPTDEPVSSWSDLDREQLITYRRDAGSQVGTGQAGNGLDDQPVDWGSQDELGAYESGSPPVPWDVDARTRMLAEVVRRQGQPEFRQQLLTAYDGRCAVSGCDVVEVLEAAHISRYRGPHTNRLTNGLLLRADIHTLFDLGMLTVDTQTMTVLLAPSLTDTIYAALAGQPLHLPADTALQPDIAALDEHRRQSRL